MHCTFLQFASSPPLGFYRLSGTRIGVSGTLIGTNTDASIALGDENSSNNPSLNFFSSNTGSYNTPSSRIQAFSGSGSANSGTIQIDAAACNIATGISGNKDNAPTINFSNATGITCLTLENAQRKRDGSFNDLFLIITGTMDSAADAQFEVSLPERTTNWSNNFSPKYGSGTCVNGAPGVEYSAVFAQSVNSSTRAQISFGGFSGTTDAVVINVYLRYERL